MKTTINIKKIAEVIIVTAILISSVVVTQTVFKSVKYQYSMLPAGSGRAYFYDVIR